MICIYLPTSRNAAGNDRKINVTPATKIPFAVAIKKKPNRNGGKKKDSGEPVGFKQRGELRPVVAGDMLI